MYRRLRFSLVALLAGIILAGSAGRGSLDAQAAPPGANLAERLGFPPDSRLVIVHADDAGATHSVNRAIKMAFENGSISSASIIVPSPWFREIAAFAKAHPEYDFGLHLALTSEFRGVTVEGLVSSPRWKGAASPDWTPSLLDPEGYLWASRQEVTANVRPEEASIELRAQIERARQFGVPITHFDTHMSGPVLTPELTEVFLALGREYDVMTNRSTGVRVRTFMLNSSPAPQTAFERALETYQKVIRETKPDEVLRILVHPGIDSDELRAAMGDGGFGASWRAADYDAFNGQEMRAFLKQHRVRLINYKHLKQLASLASGAE